MRLLFNDDVYGWRMTGLLGEGGKWFVGVSRDVVPKDDRDRMFYGDCSYWCPACYERIATPEHSIEKERA